MTWCACRDTLRFVRAYGLDWHCRRHGLSWATKWSNAWTR